ncbi:MAG: hypothetical protein WDM79_01065 [Terricaulis sp.]
MYTITLNSAAEGGEALGDPYLVLHGETGDEIASNDDSSESLNSRLRYMPAVSGDVFVEARGLGEDDVGAYQLAVVGAPLPPDNAANDSATTSRLTAGRTVDGAIEYPGDVGLVPRRGASEPDVSLHAERRGPRRRGRSIRLWCCSMRRARKSRAMMITKAR